MSFINSVSDGFNWIYNYAQGPINKIVNHPIAQKCKPVLKWYSELSPFYDGAQKIYNIYNQSRLPLRKNNDSAIKYFTAIYDTTTAILLIKSPQYLMHHRLTVIKNVQDTAKSFVITIIDKKKLKQEDLSKFSLTLLDKIEDLKIPGVNYVLPFIKNPRKHRDNLIWLAHITYEQGNAVARLYHSTANKVNRALLLYLTDLLGGTNNSSGAQSQVQKKHDDEDAQFLLEAKRLEHKENKSS